MSQRKPKLKPCPFCGGTDLSIMQFEVVTDACIHCENCGLSVEGESGVYLTLRAIAKAWNRRAGDESI